jgi:DNA-binding CsgD family transcriptional regulator
LLASSSSQNLDLTWLGLTPREQQVARLLLAGDTNPTIAQKLYIANEPVRRRLGVGNRYQAIALLNRSADPSPTSPR